MEARVSMRLTEEWSKNQPQYAATAALEATVEARVALRLEEERAVRAQQQSGDCVCWPVNRRWASPPRPPRRPPLPQKAPPSMPVPLLC